MKSLLKSCTVLATVLSFASTAVAQEPLKELGPGEGALSIVAWAGYIERGETDPNFDWVTEFEKKTGCMVSVKTAATSDEMVALMNEGGFDLVTASGDASLRLVAGKRVQPINTALIPSWNTIDERLQNAPWHTKDGVHYGTPYVWGPNVLMYNTKAFGDKAPDSWNVVFEEMTLPDGKSNKGRIQAYDGPIHVADAANYLMFHKPELGIKDPYELNEDQYKAALDLLRVQRTLVSRYWHDAFIQIDDFKNEGVVASGSWPFQVNLLKADQPIASVFPKEGVTGWADTTMLHVDSEHPNCAYMWMEHSLSPKVQGDVSAWFGTVPSVPAACKGNALLTDEGCARNGFDNFEKIKFWKTPVSKCESQGECVPYHRWVSDYIGVIGGR
ncbi:ABC transporter substrate-binding protein (plasmid) [Peteryoungia desertarenae]|uniref:ABC transporter substrate-binding protein n=1 Tax=Peteryoungia desertarenae TaxID=1813451 RepID=A0ABX6QT71_9HYPH|nr:ABC transporter substrate-binding protein [Peteryoungia desertarenae]QLF71512.1 ABC transporter substrate-binding protein [Peteryoungia desertarenae]